MLEPAAPGSRRRLALIAGAAAVVAATVIVVLATRSDDTATTSTNASDPGLTAIQSPATVTGITGAGSAVTDPVASTDTGLGGALQRTLLEPGSYNCTDTGVWQPFEENQLTLLVGEPAGGSSCTGDVLDLPVGTCSVSPCAQVPPEWRIDTLDGVPQEALMMVVAPVSAGTAQFVCVVDLVPQPKQVLLVTTTIEQACPTGASSNSIDIPYIPPDTSDIPYVPPPVSVDIPAG